jgi:hypothetical protein
MLCTPGKSVVRHQRGPAPNVAIAWVDLSRPLLRVNIAGLVESQARPWVRTSHNAIVLSVKARICGNVVLAAGLQTG